MRHTPAPAARRFRALSRLRPASAVARMTASLLLGVVGLIGMVGGAVVGMVGLAPAAFAHTQLVGTQLVAGSVAETPRADDGRDVSSTVVGAVIVLVLVGIVVLVLLRLRAARRR